MRLADAKCRHAVASPRELCVAHSQTVSRGAFWLGGPAADVDPRCSTSGAAVRAQVSGPGSAGTFGKPAAQDRLVFHSGLGGYSSGLGNLFHAHAEGERLEVLARTDLLDESGIHFQVDRLDVRPVNLGELHRIGVTVYAGASSGACDPWPSRTLSTSLHCSVHRRSPP